MEWAPILVGGLFHFGESLLSAAARCRPFFFFFDGLVFSQPTVSGSMLRRTPTAASSPKISSSTPRTKEAFGYPRAPLFFCSRVCQSLKFFFKQLKCGKVRKSLAGRFRGLFGCFGRGRPFPPDVGRFKDTRVWWRARLGARAAMFSGDDEGNVPSWLFRGGLNRRTSSHDGHEGYWETIHSCVASLDEGKAVLANCSSAES